MHTYLALITDDGIGYDVSDFEAKTDAEAQKKLKKVVDHYHANIPMSTETTVNLCRLLRSYNVKEDGSLE